MNLWNIAKEEDHDDDDEKLDDNDVVRTERTIWTKLCEDNQEISVCHARCSSLLSLLFSAIVGTIEQPSSMLSLLFSAIVFTRALGGSMK